jgi:hypothetical protein
MKYLLQGEHPPRAAQEAMSNAISRHPTEIQSFFVTKSHNPSFSFPC